MAFDFINRLEERIGKLEDQPQPDSSSVEGPVGLEGPQGKEGAKGAEGPQGKEGAKGAEGPQGKEGAKGETGAHGEPVWKGAWAAGTEYQIGQGVYNKGSSYIAIKAGKGHEPPNAEFWELIAQKGLNEGPAGGDLAGEYPNPAIGEEKVLTARIKNLAVIAAKLAGEAVETAKIKNAAVTDAKLAKPIICGSVKENGEKEAGEGFAVERTGLGLYKITLTLELATVGAIVATVTTFNRLIRNPERGKKVFTIAIVDLGEVSKDSGFNFMIKAT